LRGGGGENFDAVDEKRDGPRRHRAFGCCQRCDHRLPRIYRGFVSSAGISAGRSRSARLRRRHARAQRRSTGIRACAQAAKRRRSQMLGARMASFFSLLPVYTTTANRQMGEVSLRASGSKDLRIAVQTSFTSNAAAAMGGSAEGWTRISATKCAARTHSSACISQTPKCSTSRRTTSSRSSTVRRCAPYFSLLPLMNIMFTYEQR
jgi:hypothetical protein